MDSTSAVLTAGVSAADITSMPFERLRAALNRAASITEHAIDLAAPMFAWLYTRAACQEVVVNGLSVHCSRKLPEDPAWLARWDALCRKSPDATPFQDPVW